MITTESRDKAVKSRPLLIVAAVEFEVRPLMETLAKLGIKTEFAATGIGCLNAARSSDRLQQLAHDKDVLYVGTAGSFAEFTGPKLVRAERVEWLPPCVRHDKAWAIEGLDPPIELPPGASWAQSLPSATVLCSPTIAKSPELGSWRSEASRQQALASKDQHPELIENLELYSCAEALSQSSRSFTAIFGITNAVGPDGRKQWREHFKGLAEMTAGFVGEAMTQKGGNN